MATEDAVGTRQHILDAAEQVIQDLGIKGATTREIARRAGCAEGSIYRYFPDKHALFHAVVGTQLPAFQRMVATLPDRAGTGTVRKNLETVAIAALGFYRAILPMVAGAMSDRELMEQQRRHFQEQQGGPMKVYRSVVSYLSSERRLGRISERASPEHAARVFLGSCFSQATLEAMVGAEARLGTDEQFAKDVVRTLMEGLDHPRKADK